MALLGFLLPAIGRKVVSKSDLELLTDGSLSGYRLDGRLAPMGRPAQGVPIPGKNASHVSREKDRSQEIRAEETGG